MSKQSLKQHTSPSDLIMTKCIRCHGCLVPVHMMDIRQLGVLWEQEQRCINCGWISGPMIHPHERKRRRKAKMRKTQPLEPNSRKLHNNTLETIPFLITLEIESLKS